MGRFQRSDRDDGIDLRRALREAQADVARNRDEPPPEDERSDQERRIEGVEDAMRDHDAREEREG
jgi:hypothetical protein